MTELGDKAAMRRRMRAARAEQSPAASALRSTRACEWILQEAAYREAPVVAAYVAIGSEADPASLMHEAHRAGKRIAVPRVESDGTLSLRLWSPHTVLVEGSMGLREPAADSVETAMADVRLVIVPGLAFDLRGGRLGYGKGCYDRLLLATGSAPRIGMGFETQLVERVPTEAHDVPMDRVATEERLHVCMPQESPIT